MKTLVAVLSAIILAGGQQLVDPYDGLLQWQPPLGPGFLNPYARVPHPLQQFVPSQPPFLAGRQLPPVPVPFPAQYPALAGQFPASYPLPLPVPQQPLPVPPFTNFQPPMQVVRHGLPYSDAAAVSYSSLGYGNNPQAVPAAVNGQVRLPSVTLQAPPTVNVATQPAGVSSPVGVPVTATGVPSVVKDIASFGTGTDKSGPVARYEAINAGSVHVAPLPGHTVDQKLVAPGTTEQKL